MLQERKPIEIVASLIQQIVPLLIISKSVDPASILIVIFTVCVFPLITFILSVYHKIRRWIIGDKKVYSMSINKDINHHILWGINKYCRDNLTNFQATYIYSDLSNVRNTNTSLWNRIFYLAADPATGDVISYGNHKISVTKVDKTEDMGFNEKKSVSEYTLSCSNLKVMEEFVEKCGKEYIADFQKQLENRKNKFTNPTPHKFLENKWKACVLSVNKSFKNVFLESDSQSLITKHIELLDNADYYARSGKPRKLCMLLHGAPGCGKSSTIYAIATEFKYHIYSIKMGSISSRYTFEEAISVIPSGSMAVFEEIDMANFKNREGKTEFPKDSEAYLSLGLQDMLEVLDGYTCLNECVIILTTNHKSRLDPALLRPGRVDLEIEYKPASWQLLKRIVEYQFDVLGISHDIKETFYKDFDGLLSSAKIINICETIKSVEEFKEKMMNVLEQ